jgi:hypothetical protein
MEPEIPVEPVVPEEEPKKDLNNELTEEILKLLRSVKVDTIKEALLFLGSSEEIVSKQTKEELMKSFERMAVYRFGIKRLVVLLNERDNIEVKQKIIAFCNIEDNLELYVTTVIKYFFCFFSFNNFI